MINIGIKIRPDVGIMSGTWFPIRLINLELSGTNIFSFFQVFGRFWSILENFGFFFVAKIEKKNDVMKKKLFFQKLFDICGTVTKYELRTPRELGAIRILEK